MTCPHCKDTGVSSGAPDLGGPGTMSPCDCDAGLAWVAWGGDMWMRVWIDYDGKAWPESIPLRSCREVIPITAYRAQRDSLVALLRQANDRADRAETERDAAHRAGYDLARDDAAKAGRHLVTYDVMMKGVK